MVSILAAVTVTISSALVAFGFWCYLWPVRKGWRSAPVFVWIWIVIEVVNGLGHPAWSLVQGGYTPGVATAPLLLALAMLLSITVRSTATAALIALGLWLFLALLWPALAQMIGEVISPSDIRFAQLGLPTPATLAWQEGLSRLSPGTLYAEALVAMLNPDAQNLTTLLAQFQGRVNAPLPLVQIILQAWPQMVGLIAGIILLYVIGYVAFQRQEVRA